MMPLLPWDLGWVRDRLSRGFCAYPYDGDANLNPADPSPGQLKSAAVLIALRAKGEEPVILMTRRATHLPVHAGQISFPGGKLQEHDKDAAGAALRESWEEIGLPPEKVTLLGELPLYRTRTGFSIVPVVGWIESDFQPRPDPTEVEEIFDLPLSFILDDRNQHIQDRTIGPITRRTLVYPWMQYDIWGATAAILSNLAAALRE